MARTKKLTDPIYSPTNPTSEAAIRSQIDDSIQEVYDQSAKATDTVNLTGNQTIADVKTFSSSPIVPTPTTDFQVSTKKYVDDRELAIEADFNAKDAQNVKLTSNQTIAGVKTFSSSPIIPDPTAQNHGANKQYVDDTVANVVVGVIPDGTITDLKLSDGAGQVKARLLQAEQDIANISFPVSSVNTQTGDVVLSKTDIGLGNVDNLSATDIRSGTTKTDVGLSNVINELQFAQSNYGNISTRAASWTLILTDGNDVITVSTAAVITVPANATVAFPIGTAITFIRTGTGAVTLAPASGVTLLSKDTKRAIDGQYASATLIKTATDTWHLFGALA